ncbi:MAG: LytR C-terminal domain-containing protein [bacterium]|nr:LytR C-terminal domain-containing protein [bacterium]
MTQYPEDEFDRAAQTRGPKGVHRPAESTWRKFLPIIAAIILGPLLAWGFISALNRDNEGDPVADPTPTGTVTATEPGTGGTGETGDPGTTDPTSPAPPTDAATTEPPVTEEPEPEPQVNYDAEVTVYNGARVAGIAGRTAARLETAGFTNLTPDNWNAADPAASTVYYNNAELADTAAQVGADLGIANVSENADATESIAVVLRTDFQE